jgi:hypothetical protein
MSPIDVKAPRLVSECSRTDSARWDAQKAAEDRLRNSEYLELRHVSCDFDNGVLTLRGRVPSYHLKQLAQSLLGELAGILKLNNQLEVISSRDTTASNRRPCSFSSQPRRYI